MSSWVVVSHSCECRPYVYAKQRLSCFDFLSSNSMLLACEIERHGFSQLVIIASSAYCTTTLWSRVEVKMRLFNPWCIDQSV